MLLQTNSYIVPKEQYAAHARLLTEFRQTLARLGCDDVEVYEQVGANWDTTQSTGRFVQILRFRDRTHQLAVQEAERRDREAQARITEFCELINFPYQQEHGFFTVGFYTDALSEHLADPVPQEEAPGLGAEPDAEEAYLDQDLDEVIEAFGAPTMRLAQDESEPVSEVEHGGESHGRPPNGDAAHSHAAAEGSGLGEGIGDVLDPALLEDELDTPMEAELLEEEEEDLQPQAPPSRAGRGGKKK
ncbi:MAG TPA: hypothetical protein VLJ39_06810 [Tepidisphaeraceae bacterium]|nr:hypothetical protein [Tepidisphaeraceae bacterium]